MERKGLTLIEVILAIAIIGLIAVSFLPMITFAYKNIIGSQKFTETLYKDQEKIEDEIERLRDEPEGSTEIEVYGKFIKGYPINISTNTSGNVNFFLPKRRVSLIVPKIKLPSPEVEIRKNNVKVYPQPTLIELMPKLINEEHTLFIDEVTITNDTKDDYLMSVYRWYMSSEMHHTEPPSNKLNDYFILKEWNEAKKQTSFEQSERLKYIPNIKDEYNTIKFKQIKNNLVFEDDEFINTLGNRYIRYGVTPFSVSGRMGKEILSKPIYINAPRIEIDEARFIDYNKIYIYFKSPINDSEDSIDITNIKLNENLGTDITAKRDENNDRLLIIEFSTPDIIDTSIKLSENKLFRGAVESKEYGRISIWHDDKFEGEFEIQPLMQ